MFWFILCLCPRPPEKWWISAWSGDLVDVEDVFLGSSEFSVRAMGLVSLLLHFNACNASNLMVEILKHDQIWETIFTLASSTPNSEGTRPPCPLWFTHMVGGTLPLSYVQFCPQFSITTFAFRILLNYALLLLTPLSRFLCHVFWNSKSCLEVHVLT